jgi:hypothetical protein
LRARAAFIVEEQNLITMACERNSFGGAQRHFVLVRRY